jgi:CheY-like chemotaxis protein
MLDQEEIRWVKSTANDLNNLLQVISESSQVIENLCGKVPDAEKYFGILRNGVERAARVTQIMITRVGGYSTGPSVAMPSVTAPAVHAPTPVVVAPVARTATAVATPARAAATTIAPAPVSSPATLPPIPGDVKVNNPTGTRELVMIVDDEDFMTLLAQRVLTDEGYRVVTAKDGFQALELYRKLREHLSLVILDFTMPVMDGADVFNELLAINPRVPVVLSSGFAEQDAIRAMLARGLRGFIPKPYTQKKLLEQVRSVLDTLQSERNRQRRVL